MASISLPARGIVGIGYPRTHSALLFLAYFALACPSCKRSDTSEGPPAASHAPASTATASVGAVVHDPANPPIDCPLRKAGIDPTGMKPFDDVAKYIAFLEREDRALWQKPDEVVSALRLEGTETVVDVGAGSGYFAFRFAKALPDGRVVAADVEPEMVRHVHHTAVTRAIPNLTTQLLDGNAPDLTKNADIIFVCDVLHHVADRPRWLARVASQMGPKTRLALLEFKEGDLPEGPPAAAKIPRAELIRLTQGVGLVLAEDHGDLLPYQVFLEFKKP